MNIGLSAWVQLFLKKKKFLDQIMMIWSIQTLKNVPKHFQTRGFHHTPPRNKSETGQNLLIFGQSSILYRDLAWKWLSAWVQIFLKNIFSGPDNDDMVNTNAKKCTKAFLNARVSSYTPSKKIWNGAKFAHIGKKYTNCEKITAGDFKNTKCLLMKQ